MEDAWVFSKMIAKAQPAKVVAVCYGHAANENGRLIEQMLQTHGINAKCFDEDLDEMLKKKARGRVFILDKKTFKMLLPPKYLPNLLSRYPYALFISRPLNNCQF